MSEVRLIVVALGCLSCHSDQVYRESCIFGVLFKGFGFWKIPSDVSAPRPLNLLGLLRSVRGSWGSRFAVPLRIAGVVSVPFRSKTCVIRHDVKFVNVAEPSNIGRPHCEERSPVGCRGCRVRAFCLDIRLRRFHVSRVDQP